MAYKDEYEVARLHLKQDLARALADEYPDGVDVRYHLHPPILRALGWTQKITLGPWFDGAFRLLVRLRGLRGTAWDPFGRAEVRRVERELIGEYRVLIDKAIVDLSPAGYERAVKLATLPDLIRGYESIKLRNIARFREEVRTLGF
jgi:indolepyruvate ferredoxin oxidoreductase